MAQTAVLQDSHDKPTSPITVINMQRTSNTPLINFVLQRNIILIKQIVFVFIFAAALSDILGAFNEPENALRMDEARDNAGNDMLKMMQMVFPVATQIQMDVITKYGFPADGDGVFYMYNQGTKREQLSADCFSSFIYILRGIFYN